MKNENMTKYFRNVLATQYRGQIDLNKMRYQIISMDDFLYGSLSDMVINKLGGDKVKEEIKVIFAVKTIKTKYMEGEKVKNDFGELTGVLYIPAKIAGKEGGRQLQPVLNEEKLPWIPRELLEPLAEPGLSFGNSEDSDKYFESTTAEKNKIDTWKDYIKYCKNYFCAVTGTALNRTEDYKRKIEYEKQVYVFVDDRINTVKQIIYLYDDILNEGVSSRLYETFMNIPEAVLAEPISYDDFDSMQKHSGQMGGMYPLSKSQRQSVNCFNNLEDGEILAVSGPPGTGKTTLLQSIVAGVFVKAALEKTDPPVIVATSANNQAVTNIIESFGKIETSKDLNNLDQRWIENVNSFAVYFPSKNKEKEALDKGYQITNSGNQWREWEHFVRDIDNNDNIEASKEAMFNAVREYFGKEFENISDCKERIYSNLCEIEKKRVDILEVIRNLKDELSDQSECDIENKTNVGKTKRKMSFFRKKDRGEKGLHEKYTRIQKLKERLRMDISDLCCLKCKLEESEIMELLESGKAYEINESLDKKVRYPEFWLAVHYFECRYLEGEYKASDKQKKSQIDDVYRNMYHRLALVAPCMVMTFYSLPNNFRVYNKSESRSTYLYNFADLLIVDEAGQATPEVAAASFALAKKALVVGDEQQIPPVWNVEKKLDMALAMECHVIEDVNEYQILEESGHGCAHSSVMRIAKNACRHSWKSKDGIHRGVFLSEHRRCYDEIIDYCNELVYGGALEACRGSWRNDRNQMKFPAMGHHDISCDKSKIENGSRVNKEEAEGIVRWLKKNYNDILACYPDVDKRQVLAIITPFKAQAVYLKKVLRETMEKDVGQNIDVGTVHTFQGAERRIIIFSIVYGKDEQCAFIDSNAALMNVAVSRAKDAFWVFGSYDCLRGGKVSELLKEYVKERIE